MTRCSNHETLEGLKFGMCECSYKRFRAQENEKNRTYYKQNSTLRMKHLRNHMTKISSTGITYYKYEQLPQELKDFVKIYANKSRKLPKAFIASLYD